MKYCRDYLGCKTTEVSRKQINVLFAKAKCGELNIKKWIMNDFYNIADYKGYDDNGSIADDERSILRIIQEVFNGTIEKTQDLIDTYTEETYNRLGTKMKEYADKNCEYVK